MEISEIQYLYLYKQYNEFIFSKVIKTKCFTNSGKKSPNVAYGRQFWDAHEPFLSISICNSAIFRSSIKMICYHPKQGNVALYFSFALFSNMEFSNYLKLILETVIRNLRFTICGSNNMNEYNLPIVNKILAKWLLKAQSIYVEKSKPTHYKWMNE